MTRRHSLALTIRVACVCAAPLLLVLAAQGCSNSEPTVQPSVGAKCRTDSDCVAGSYCHESGVCVENCSSSAECAPGETCKSGRCIAPVAPADCAYPCPNRMHCVAGECLWDCVTTDDCPGGAFCLASHCQWPACTKNTDCGDAGACSSGQCVVGGCRANAECKANLVCKNAECQPVPECVVDGHCGCGQTCVAGVCTGITTTCPISVPTPCEINRDCGERVYCVAGVCQYSIQCRVHADCLPGEACFGSQCWDLP